VGTENFFKKWSVLIGILVLVLILAMAISGCDSNSDKSKITLEDSVKISILPEACEVVTQMEKEFKVAIYNANNEVVSTQGTWSVDNSEFGQIDSKGVFTAKKNGKCTITCTSGNLTKTATVQVIGVKAAKEQIITDTKVVYKKFEDISKLKYEQIFKVVQNEITPNMTALEQAVSKMIAHGNDPRFYSELFRLKSGEYNDSEIKIDLTNNKDSDQLYEGVWTVKFSDGWNLKAERKVNGAKDQVTIEQTNTNDAKLLYHGEVSYLTSYLVNTTLSSNLDMSIKMNLKDKDLQEATCEGMLQANLEVTEKKIVDVKGKLNGSFNLKHGTNGNLNFKGEMICNSIKNGENSFNGEVNTNDLLIIGKINLKLVPNKNGINETFPAEVTFDAKFVTKDADPLKLEGVLTVQIKNAATINTKIAYSSTNWMNAKLDFDGLLQANASSFLKIKLSGEEVAYGKYTTTLRYELNNGGLQRVLDFELDNLSSSELQMTISSSYGAMSITLNAKFEGSIAKGQLKEVTGNVKSEGKEIGTVSLESTGLKIAYKDGSFEIL